MDSGNPPCSIISFSIDAILKKTTSERLPALQSFTEQPSSAHATFSGTASPSNTDRIISLSCFASNVQFSPIDHCVESQGFENLNDKVFSGDANGYIDMLSCVSVNQQVSLHNVSHSSTNDMLCELRYPQIQRVPASCMMTPYRRRTLMTPPDLLLDGCISNKVSGSSHSGRWAPHFILPHNFNCDNTNQLNFQQLHHTATVPSSSYHQHFTSTKPTSLTSSSSGCWSRAVFSNLQRKGLERSFRAQSYISRRERQKLAATLGLNENQVRIWFANRRMKDKKTARTKLDKKSDRKVTKLINTSITTLPLQCST